MCGILGYTSFNKNTKALLPVMATFMDARGREASGWTDGQTIIKGVGSILDKYTDPGFAEDSSMIAHCRAPSCGANTDLNSHPFHWRGPDGHSVIGIHNGHISNWHMLRSKYSATRSAAEVDSQQIFAALAERTSLAELDGWGTVAWYEYEEGLQSERALYLSTFERGELAIAQLSTGEIAFASTATCIERAAHFTSVAIEFFYEVTPKRKYQLTDNKLYDLGKLDWGAKPLAYTAASQSFSHKYSGAAALDAFCKRPCCHVKLLHPQKQLICDECFDKALDSYIGTTVPEPQTSWIA